MAKVTIYIVNYNYGKYLEKAFLSVISQTYKNIEIIIIDDASTDNSIQVIQKLKLKYNFITIRNKHNVGLAVVNNQAIRTATGEFIMRLDADDFLESNCVDELVRLMQSNSEIAIAFGNWNNIDENGNFISTEKRLIIDENTLLDTPAHGACTLFKREFLIQVNGYNEKYRKQDGYYIWLNLISLYKVINTDKVLFNYRKHNKSLSSDIDDLLKVRSEILKSHSASLKIEQIKTLAIIVIRSYKNLFVEYNAKPLIDYILEPILNSKLISNIAIVSSDLFLKQYILEKYSQIVFIERSKDLEDLNINIKESIRLALKNYANLNFDNILIRGEQTPFITKSVIESSICYKHIFKKNHVICVEQIEDKIFIKVKDGLKTIYNYGSKLKLEEETLYKKIPGFYLLDYRDWEQKFTFDSNQSVGYVLCDSQSKKQIK
jgi:glycosyltransferase involved in cell wall biosynthesis